MTPKKRFRDNLTQGSKEPHEDEMALCIMTRRSNMLSWAFPARAEVYDRYLAFNQTSERERTNWKRALDTFVRKLTLKTRKRLVLKSPNHTARLRMLLELYPNAKFLHIKRNPYDVFRSMCHMVREVTAVWGLQHIPPEAIPAIVLDTYRRLYDAYFEQRPLIPTESLHELSFEYLDQHPLQALEGVYESLSLGGFEAVRRLIEDYTARNASYRKNRHAELTERQRRTLEDSWGHIAESLGYTFQETRGRTEERGPPGTRLNRW